ncbi:DMT family transporter [Salinarimonas sp.]|uniref:DMT family transporter n=1 Tax=Salinarimonas sp. TaxID=2766526 RepID=UPI0032D99F28
MSIAAPDRVAPGAASFGFVAGHLIAAGLFWGSGFLFIKLVTDDLAPLALAAVRASIAVVALGLVFVATRRSLVPRGREWRDWAFLGACNSLVPNTLTAYALIEIGAGLAAMIQAAGPIMVAVMAHGLYAEERLDLRRVLGVLVGFAGMGLLIGPAALPGLEGMSLPHALAMVATAFCYSVGALYVRAIPKAEPIRLAFGQQVFGAVPGLLLAIVIIGPASLAPAAQSPLPLLALGIVATAAPIFLFMRLLRAAGPTRASMVGYLQPVFAAGLGWLVLNETIGLREAAGGVVILIGVALVTLKARPARP